MTKHIRYSWDEVHEMWIAEWSEDDWRHVSLVNVDLDRFGESDGERVERCLAHAYPGAVLESC